MVRRSFRRGLRLGLLVGALVALVKIIQSLRASDEPPAYVAPPSPWPPTRSVTTEPQPEPASKPEPAMEAATFVEAAPATEAAPRRERPLKAPPAKKAPKVTKKAAPAETRIWVEPSGTVCPPSHPIKAKLSSKLFHLPGMFAYDRCNPDRCYATEAGAVADGLVKAKR